MSNEANTSHSSPTLDHTDQKSLHKVSFSLLANIDASSDKVDVASSRKRPIDVGTQSENKGTDIDNDEKVKEIGKKFRQILHEEKSKRKEIVRLESPVKPLESNKEQLISSTTTFSKSVRQSHTKKVTTKKPSKSRKSPHNNIEEDIKRANVKVDTWVPQTHHLKRNNLHKEEKSNLVRLHGLPVGVTADQIYKFFSGLSPQRLFVLPSLDVTIKDFDVTDSDDSGDWRIGKRKNQVKRYSNHFRVFVKFQSYLVADNAISRSGETIDVDANTAVSIAISPVSKRYATHLQKYMGIDVKRGESVEYALNETEDQIPYIVNDLIWSMASKELNLTYTKPIIGGTGPYPIVETSELYHIFPPSTIQQEGKMIALHNNLCDIHDRLEQDCCATKTLEIDPIYTIQSPVHHLTLVASTWILNQLECIRKCLNSYRYHNIMTK